MPSIKPDELANLRDVHLPAPIGYWPWAYGWTITGFLLLIAGGVLFFFLKRHYLNTRAKRQALKLLNTYQQQYVAATNTQVTAARISELLKRVALAYFPRSRVASLQGDQWLVFLNETGRGVDFTTVSEELLYLPYQPSKTHDLNALFDISRQWISQRSGACLN